MSVILEVLQTPCSTRNVALEAHLHYRPGTDRGSECPRFKAPKGKNWWSTLANRYRH